ncbi:MAG TPA: flagellar biosynthesis anti-sigma factor FlgM [Bryobacteraceae bacterium]|jgi:anti-sigma28 factor (negative regulator of flagellin synthesis)|nr:flagellar biosynthesis anti-sigma factor FlgM [Bryobacteraceae bacterium]
MRIDDLNRTPVTQVTEKPGQTAQKDTVEKNAVGGADQAEVSHLAQSLSAPEPGRIEELRRQVESGSYEVSPQAVANALIDAHLTE